MSGWGKGFPGVSRTPGKEQQADPKQVEPKQADPEQVEPEGNDAEATEREDTDGNGADLPPPSPGENSSP